MSYKPNFKTQIVFFKTQVKIYGKKQKNPALIQKRLTENFLCSELTIKSHRADIDMNGRFNRKNNLKKVLQRPCETSTPVKKRGGFRQKLHRFFL